MKKSDWIGNVLKTIIWIRKRWNSWHTLISRNNSDMKYYFSFMDEKTKGPRTYRLINGFLNPNLNLCLRIKCLCVFSWTTITSPTQVDYSLACILKSIKSNIFRGLPSLITKINNKVWLALRLCFCFKNS